MLNSAISNFFLSKCLGINVSVRSCIVIRKNFEVRKHFHNVNHDTDLHSEKFGCTCEPVYYTLPSKLFLTNFKVQIYFELYLGVYNIVIS